MFAWGTEELAEHFGATAFELRYDALGRCAVRVAGGDVLHRHVEPAPPTAAWTAEARCGAAAGWLLAAAPPTDPAAVTERLHTLVARRTAFVRERQAFALAALDAELIERLTHRLRTDVMTLSAVAEGALEGVFADEAAGVLEEIQRTSAEGQRRITAAREVMTTLEAGAGDRPESIATTLRAELEGMGRAGVPVTVIDDEEPWARIGGAGWAACARLLAAESHWERFAVEPDAGGWRVTGAAGDSGQPIAWSHRELGALTAAGHIVVAAGGHAAAGDAAGAVAVTLVVPAAPGSLTPR